MHTDLEALAIAARDAIGSKHQDDWYLRPHDHAGKLKLPQAQPLLEILEGAEVKAIADAYEGEDAAALAAQSPYKLWLRAAVVLRLTAILIGTAFFLPISRLDTAYMLSLTKPEWLTGLPFSMFCTGLQMSCLAAAFLITKRIMSANWYGDWKTHRNAAELARVKLFNVVLAHALTSSRSPAERELPLLPLALEYFRRYQVQVQHVYYFKRARQLRLRFRWKTRIIIAIIALAIAVGVNLLVNKRAFLENFTDLHETLMWVGHADGGQFMMMVVTAFSGLHLALSLIGQMELDERNSLVYTDMAKLLREALDESKGSVLHTVRLAAADKDAKQVRTFVENLQRQMAAEHAEWKSLRDHSTRADELLKTYVDPVREGLPGT